ncbi:MAG: sigma-54-dependent Fis family transcriptional regulator [Gemmatimonadetes bacterium]|jgi:two-component system, NtrC family, response regulator AtoC|nr:sigma-54-dependent Fis family transcriptional regulator [Gemmatimonadota bacterium]MBT6144998.1 sigma-54-dependent Fis family transcriptional regulator [Gemmatimonadota bacterium]MBT7863552.1 sigma-54-dependent Fis family transcriptional regulator [Gemmatimonadota bacterium]
MTQPPDRATILVVDDNPSHTKALEVRLSAAGYDVLKAHDGSSALAIVTSHQPDLVLLDLMMPGMDGYETCRRIKEQQGDDFVPVILVTASAEGDAVVKGLEQGADEYVIKPFNPLELMARVHSMLRIRRMYLEAVHLRREIAGRHRFDQIIGQSPAMDELYDILPKVTESNVSVMLSGESGTGKEAVARSIHYNSRRRSHRFVAVNCGALAAGLLESELFGHAKGAFTGATEDRPGLVESAHLGTLFLDEIGETAPDMQVKLLRVLQEGAVTRVGENEPRRVDARIIAATNRSLEADVKEGRFREDLFYRLNVFPIALPPLRQRTEDVALLADHFLKRHGEAVQKKVTGFTPEAMDALSRFDWPGNVRELENEIERAIVLTPQGGVIDTAMLSERLRPAVHMARSWRRDGRLKDVIAEVEADLIQQAFRTHEGNKTRMSEDLGISRYTLLQKMKAYGIE